MQRRCGTAFLGMLTLRGRCPAADAGARQRRDRHTPDTTRPRCVHGRPGRASRSTSAGASRQKSWRSSGPPATELNASGRRGPDGQAEAGDGPQELVHHAFGAPACAVRRPPVGPFRDHDQWRSLADLHDLVRSGGPAMGEARARLEQNVQHWNAHDSAAWVGDFSPDAQIVGPGASGLGTEMVRTFYSIWQDAFPNNEVRVTDIFEDGAAAILQAEFRGTQTETMNAPEQTIPATGKRVNIPFVTINRFDGGKITQFKIGRAHV